MSGYQHQAATTIDIERSNIQERQGLMCKADPQTSPKLPARPVAKAIRGEARARHDWATHRRTQVEQEARRGNRQLSTEPPIPGHGARSSAASRPAGFFFFLRTSRPAGWCWFRRRFSLPGGIHLDSMWRGPCRSRGPRDSWSTACALRFLPPLGPGSAAASAAPAALTDAVDSSLSATCPSDSAHESSRRLSYTATARAPRDDGAWGAGV